jgi:restriction system protein
MTVWGVHAGKKAEAESIFTKDNVVAIGWHELGDLSSFINDREGIKKLLRKHLPHKTNHSINAIAGQIYRFLHEVTISDVVVFLPLGSPYAYIGKVASDYIYDPASSPDYPNQRKVSGYKQVLRQYLSDDAKKEIKASLSLFTISKTPEEFVALFNS